MQTLYYTTSNFIRHTGNVIDSGEYREKLSRATGEDAFCDLPSEASVPAAARPRRKRRSLARSLDVVTSLALLVMTLSVMLRLVF